MNELFTVNVRENKYLQFNVYLQYFKILKIFRLKNLFYFLLLSEGYF